MTSGRLLADSESIKEAFSKHSEHSESTQKATREYLKSNQREREQSDFIIHHVRSFIR